MVCDLLAFCIHLVPAQCVRARARTRTVRSSSPWHWVIQTANRPFLQIDNVIKFLLHAAAATAAGGGTWYTEPNRLSGVQVRSSWIRAQNIRNVAHHGARVAAVRRHSRDIGILVTGGTHTQTRSWRNVSLRSHNRRSEAIRRRWAG